MKPLRVLLILLIAASASSQPTIPPPLSLVKQFLSLTDAQVTAVLQNNDEYNQFSSQEQQTIGNAQAQIAVETAKEQLDPLAIGSLYAGIESACRDLRDKAAASQQQNLAVLTDAQMAKLNMLNDAMKLAPTIAEAQSGDLLSSAISPPYAFTGDSSGFAVLSSQTPGVVPCSVSALSPGNFVNVTFPGNIIPGVPVSIPSSRFLPQVTQFLGLTGDQVTAILQNDQAYNAFSFEELQAIRNAQSQIAVDTTADQLDPLALGTLYAGIESACRDLRGHAASSRQQNVSILTDTQTSKLNMLNDAMNLAPTISEAQNGNLFGSALFPPYSFIGSNISFASTTGFSSSGVSGCGTTGGLSGGFTGLLLTP